MTHNAAFEQAKRKVKSIKRFYSHVAWFVLIGTLLLSIKGNIIRWVSQQVSNPDIGFLKWLDWNILAIPIIWGVVVIVHGYYVFGFSVTKRQEQ